VNLDTLLSRHYPNGEPIAVVGYACRFPEAADSEAYWNNLVAGRECGRRFSREELLDAGVSVSILDDPAYVPWGTVIADADVFDAELFGYSRQEAELMDPQQRLFLQIAWHALEHAGYAPRATPHKTGVFGASRISTYPGREAIDLARAAHVRSMQSLMGNDKDYVATRVAYKLDLHGPAITVQTACSSSLVATHMACESLRSGECDMAIAGGVAVSFPQVSGYLYQQGMIFSPDGHCRPFDAQARGTYAGNGVAAVVLQRLSDALREDSPIAAVVLGSAINNDGRRKVGYTAPSVAGQRAVIAEAWALAGVRSQQIGMIEAHGTATPLGDSIEVQALRSVFHAPGQGPACALGSVKGNMGHLDTAAGIASFLKTVLAVERGVIPPCVNFDQANPVLRLDDGPFHVPVNAQPWDTPARTAGVSSFGIGGTNCHMVVASLPHALRQYAETARASARSPAPPDAEDILPLGAHSEGALRRLAGAYSQALRRQPAADLVRTAWQGRQLDMPWRLVAPVCDETADALAAFAQGEEDILIQSGHDAPGKQVWLFTGQGSQWPGMSQSWYARSPAFAAGLERCLAVFDTARDKAFLDTLRRALMESGHEVFQRMEYAQPAIVAFELAMAAHWRALGLAPDMTIGHSVGEFAATVAAGCYTHEQIMPLMRSRGALMDRCGGGAMLSVFAGEAESLPVATRLGLDLAAYNGEQHLVFSGARDLVERMARELDSMNLRSNLLAVTGAAHSRMLDGVLDEFQQASAVLRARDGATPCLSGLTGLALDARQLNAPDFWRRHMRGPVRFIQCLRKAVADGAGLFVEMGADAALTGIGRRELADAARWIACARRGQPADRQIRQALAQFYVAGVELPWPALLSGTGRRCRAPLYPFDRGRYWREAPAAATDSPAGAMTDLPTARDAAVRLARDLDLPRLRALYACVAQLHAIYVDRLARRCVGNRIEQGATVLDILRGGRLLPRYRQLLARLLNACVEDGVLRARDGAYVACAPVPHDAYDDLLHEFKGYCEGLDAVAETAQRAGERLYAMMSGEVEPVAVIFPEGASGSVEALYQDFSFGRYFNQIAARVVADLARGRPSPDQAQPAYRVLEVGGGTGGTTSWLLPALSEQPNVTYVFTDISPIFTRRAEQKFAGCAFMEYREFDLQESAEAQGFLAGDYDLIVAANVIHATQHVGYTLVNLLPLLKPGGKLLMREITRPMRLFDFVFGTLVPPLRDEAARGGEVFLTTSRWREQCLAAGFARVEWLPEDGAITSDMSEHIVLATAPGARVVETDMPSTAVGGLLGQALTNDGGYLVDWSDCAGYEARWQARVSAACAEMARRHGDGRAAPCPDMPPRAPDWLNLVRLRWRAKPMAPARVELSARAPDGTWRCLGADAVTDGGDLPALVAVPETHYDWRWARVDLAVTLEKTFRARFRPLFPVTEALETALAAVGVTLETDAEDALLILESTATLATMTEHLFDAMADDKRGRIVVVTRFAWAVVAGDVVRAAHHAAWGLARVAAVEFAAQDANRTIAAVDMGVAPDWRDLVTGLRALAQGAQWVAARGGQAWTPWLAPQKYVAPTLPAQGLAGNGWYVVTGGLGGLGRLSARWLASRGARRIALLGRREHEDAAAFVADLERQYACVVALVVCDVADPGALDAALDTLRADSGIVGVIHAAGVLDDGMIADPDRSRLAPVLAVKAHAARQIYERLLAMGDRSWLLLYSSAAAALGRAGQAIHALASAYLDGLAHEAATSGENKKAVTVVSIGWGAWGETGRVVDRDLQKRLAEDGMGVLSDAEGLWHLEQAIARAAPYRLAMRVFPERLGEARGGLLGLKQSSCRQDAAVASAGVARSPAALRSTVDLLPEHLGNIDVVSKWLAEQIAAQLRLDNPARLSPGRDLVQLGLDSLLFLELSSTIQRRLGVRVDAEEAYRDLTIDGLSRLIAAQAPDEARQLHTLRHDARGRYQPFPLTPIQHAYWMGRTNLIDYGGVACHVLFEWDLRHDQLDLNRFEQAWNALVRRHDMLRVVIGEDGWQRVLPQVADYRIERRDLSRLPSEERERMLAETRQALSRRVLPADRWPLFELAATEWEGGRYRLHMNLDLLLFDVQSFKVMMDDLATFYRGGRLEPLRITFRDCVLDERARRLEPAWLESWCYWQARLADFPPAPRLPLSERQPAAAPPRCVTRKAVLERECWEALKQVWRAWGVTPSAALMTLFAGTLERWARWPCFTLNLTFFNRPQVHPQMRQLIGDFTSVLLVDFDLGDVSRTTRQCIEQTQQRLWRHLAHSQVNGVELLREIGRLRGQSHSPLMPIVFTSMLGMTLDGLTIDQAMTGLLGDPVHVFTQTPQVWLDHQVMEIDGELVFSWHCMDEVLADGAAQAMFEDYRSVLRAVAAQPELMTQDGLWRRFEGQDIPQRFERRKWPVDVGGVTVDLRDVEDAVRQQEGVLRVDAREDAEAGCLRVKVVAAERAHDPARFPGQSLEGLPGLVGLDAAEQDHFDAVWLALEARALRGIATTLANHGLFVQEGQTAERDEIHRCLKVLPQFERIVRQWLRALCEAGWLVRNGQVFSCARSLARMVPAPAMPSSPWGDALAAYLDRSVERHAELLQGSCSALELFFGDDDAITRVLYAENPAARRLIRNVEHLVRALVARADADGGLCVMEVGAGTGATTGVALDALEGRRRVYRFTDVSTFFLDEARKRFAGRDHMEYGIFDINQPVDYAAYPPLSHDLVIAAQVMHDAGHVVRSLRRVGSLMKPGARLLLIESTCRDSLLQMASVGFIEGLGHYQDHRVIDDRAMLNLAQWRDALQEAGFSLELAWPEQDVSPIHQHVILARAIRAASVDCRQLEQDVSRRLGNAFLSVCVRQSEPLDMFMASAPGPGNARDMSGVATTMAEGGAAMLRMPGGGDGAPSDTLQHRVAQVWRAFLGKPVGPESHFFLIGGDSLIATRVVAQINRIGIAGASLQALFAHPTLAEFCATLKGVENGEMEDMLVSLARGMSNESLFVFHASDGGVASYLTFADALDCRVWGLRAPETIEADSLRELAAGYLRVLEQQPGAEPFTLLGWSYGATVAAEVARVLHHRGKPTRLILIDPVCGADFVAEDLPALLRLLARARDQIVLPDDWARLDETARIESFVRGAVVSGMLDPALPMDIARQRLTRIHRLLGLLSKHQAGASVPVPLLWIEADRHPGHWTPAAREWSAWKARAQTHVVEADHWQLMEDATVAASVAALVRQWLSRNPCQAQIR
jgi:yersiniabactin nonribosomal peptide/polyketide synthase